MAIEDLKDRYSSLDAIDQLASLYVNNSSDMVVPLDLMQEITNIYRDLTIEEAVGKYVEAFLKKAKEMDQKTEN